MRARAAWLGLRALLRRRQVERELDEELAFHLEMQERKHMAAGLTAGEARARARREFGNVELVKEDSRDARGVRALEELRQDVRFGARLLRRDPGFAMVAVVAIGLAIGINAGFFTLIDAFVWRPIPVAHPERLVKLALRFSGGGGTIVFSRPQVHAMAAHGTTLADLLPEARCVAVAFRASASSTAIAAAPGCVSGNYFGATGGDASVGRPLVPADDRDGAPPAIVLSDALWTRAFGRDPGVVGRAVIVNGVHATVVGVIRRTFVGVRPIVPDFWMTNAMGAAVGATPGRVDDPANRFMDVRARLREGVTREQAEAELSGLVAEPAPAAGARDGRVRVTGVGLTPNDAMLPLSWQTTLVLAPAIIVVALVLVIACANLANLMLSRALARRREIGIRLALGASRGRIVRQLLTEGLMIAIAGALLGLVLSRWTVQTVSRAFFAELPATFGTIALDLSPSWRVVAYTIALAGVAVLSFGLVPALQVTSPSLGSALKGEDIALGLRIRRSRFRDALVALQVAGSLVLLVASGTLVASMRSVGASAPGLEATRVTVATLGLAAPGRLAPELAAARATFAARVSALPHTTATATALHPLFTTWWPLLRVATAGGEPAYRHVASNTVTPGYFDVVRQRIVSGRAFTAADSATGADVAIITAAAARALWPAAPAVGQQLRVAASRDGPDRLVRVVGVASDARSQSILDDDDARYIYLVASPRDLATNDMVLLVRGDTTPPAMMRAIADAAHRVAPDLPLRVAPALAAREAMLTPIRYGTWVTTAIGAFGLGLALIGLYGIVAFAVVQRRRELAVHVAMGALPRDVLRLVLARELRLVGAGLGLGLMLSFVEARLIAAWVVPLASLGPSAFAGLAALVLAVACLACIVPARTALRLAPMTVLRQ